MRSHRARQSTLGLRAGAAWAGACNNASTRCCTFTPMLLRPRDTSDRWRLDTPACSASSFMLRPISRARSRM